MTVEKPTLSLLLQPIITGVNKAMNQAEFQTVSCNLLKALVLVLFLIGWKTGMKFRV